MSHSKTVEKRKYSRSRSRSPSPEYRDKNRNNEKSKYNRDDRNSHADRRNRSSDKNANSGGRNRHGGGNYFDDQSKTSNFRNDRRKRNGLKFGQEFAPFERKGSPVDDENTITPEERDACTVFVWQLSARIRPRDLEEFFSPIGRVRDVRLIMDSRTKRSKGIAYVEFFSADSVLKAIAVSGTKLLGVPLQIQMSQAEKNRMASTSLPYESPTVPDNLPLRLSVSSLNYNITETMLKSIFEPFGQIDDIGIARDSGTRQSLGHGFVTYNKARDAKRAMEQLNGFELAGRAIKINIVQDRHESSVYERSLDVEETDRMGHNLGSSGRLALMAKLAEGTGLVLPKVAQNALAMSQITMGTSFSIGSNSIVPSTCILLSNMFDTRENPAYDEIAEDVREECAQLGPVIHVYVDRSPSSSGNVYVKLASIATAGMCVNKLHGRFFSGRIISAEFFSLIDYNRLFPESVPKH